MDYTFFAIQVAIKAFRDDPLRAQLHAVIAESDAEQSFAEKRAFYKRLAGLLGDAVPVFEMGFWDYVTDARKAEEQFETWCSEIEGGMATEHEELGAGADEVNRLSSEKDYLLVSLLFLVERGSGSDRTLAERCDLPEKDWFTRLTFGRLIGGVPMLNFATVQADAVYLMPGSEADGLSMEDLHSGDYDYLKPLS